MNRRPTGDGGDGEPPTHPRAEIYVGLSSAAVAALALLAFLLTRQRAEPVTSFADLMLTHASLPTAVVAGIVHAGWQGGVATTRWRRHLAWASAGLGVASLTAYALLVAVLVLGFAHCLQAAGAELLIAPGILSVVALAVAAAAAWWARTTRWPGVRAAAWALSCAVAAPGMTVGLVSLIVIGSACSGY